MPTPPPVDPHKHRQDKLKANRDFSYLNESDSSQTTTVRMLVLCAPSATCPGSLQSASTAAAQLGTLRWSESRCLAAAPTTENSRRCREVYLQPTPWWQPCKPGRMLPSLRAPALVRCCHALPCDNRHHRASPSAHQSLRGHCNLQASLLGPVLRVPACRAVRAPPSAEQGLPDLHTARSRLREGGQTCQPLVPGP